jgi:hypothetical protein
MSPVRLLFLFLSLTVLAACQKNDLMEPPVYLGDFVLGHNIVIADKVTKSPVSRNATPEEWKAAMTKAMNDRFGRYSGSRIYNIGISVDGYALAPPGIPIVAKPASALIITAHIWDDATATKLNPEGKQFTIFEKASGETFIGSGLTRSREQQMEILSYNAAKSIEGWLLAHPEWLGLPTKGQATPTVAAGSAPPAASTAIPVPKKRPGVAG